MDPIRPVAAMPRVIAVDAWRPAEPVAGTDRTTLAPAVSLDLSAQTVPSSWTDGADAERRGYERDVQTKTLVFRISDAVTGDVVVQIPDEIVLKARAYARGPNLPSGERIVRSA